MFSNYFIPLERRDQASGIVGNKAAFLAYGDFITILINFLMSALFRRDRGTNSKSAARRRPPPEVVLLTQIRDELAARR